MLDSYKNLKIEITLFHKTILPEFGKDVSLEALFNKTISMGCWGKLQKPGAGALCKLLTGKVSRAAQSCQEGKQKSGGKTFPSVPSTNEV